MEKSDAVPGQAPEGLPASAPVRPARRWSRRALLRGGVLGAAGLAVAATCGVFHETHALEIERVAIPLPRLPSRFHGMTIAQLSDIHFGPLVDPAFIGHAVDLTLGLEPDLIVLTGDYVSRRTDEEPRLIKRELGRLSAPEGVWAVLGNHDIYNWDKPTVAALEAANIRVLRNANTALHRSGDRLWLAGVDDVTKSKHDLARALAGIDQDEAAIALVHEPDFADEVAQDGRVCLQLSGHSHGGQVCCPLLGPPCLPRLARKYPSGLYRVGGLWLYTNRGLGVMGLPVRLNCRPEITLFTLTADDPGGLA
jgi:predicted MPP superfamily phosphohydrolase